MTPGRLELEEECAFLLRSIEDLDAERAAGDLSDTDYRVLRDRYTVRAAAVLRAIDEPTAPAEHPASTSPPPPSPHAEPGAVAATPATHRDRLRRRALVWGALGLFGAAAVVLLVAELATRLPGQTSTGSLQLNSAQQLQRTLNQAATLETQGDAAQALVLYHQILRRDPTQEQALAESGWLEFEAGVSAQRSALLSQGQRDEQAAEQADPSAYAPHLYLGSMLLVERQPAAAADEFGRFLAAGPPTSVIQRAWPYVTRANTDAGRPVPPAPAGVSG